MALTQQQIEQRKGLATASVVPWILGLDKHRGPLDAYHAIRGEVEPSAEESAAARMGSRLEGPIIDVAAEMLGVEVSGRQVWRVAGNGLMGATIDAVLADGRNVEVKTTAIINPMLNTDDWGEPGSGDVPVRVLAQVAAQFICSPGVEWCVVPAAIRSAVPRLYFVRRDAEACSMIEVEVLRFMEAHVLPGNRPEFEWRGGTGETLARLRREPGKTQAIPAWLCELARNHHEAHLTAEAQWMETRARLMAALGDAEVGVDSTLGERICTFLKTSGRTTIDAAGLAAAHPKIAEKFTRRGDAYRVLRMSDSKRSER